MVSSYDGFGDVSLVAGVLLLAPENYWTLSLDLGKDCSGLAYHSSPNVFSVGFSFSALRLWVRHLQNPLKQKSHFLLGGLTPIKSFVIAQK